MITLNPQMFQRIRAIEWFAHCGDPLDLPLDMEVVRAVSWKDAIKHERRQVWELATLHARNALTMHLAFNHKDAYNDLWNPLVMEAKAFIAGEVTPKIEAVRLRLGQPDDLIASVQWNLLGAFMEDAYVACHPPTDFFLQLLRVYEAGHLPCGWKGGEWPDGRLVVF